MRCAVPDACRAVDFFHSDCIGRGDDLLRAGLRLNIFRFVNLHDEGERRYKIQEILASCFEFFENDIFLVLLFLFPSCKLVIVGLDVFF